MLIGVLWRNCEMQAAVCPPDSNNLFGFKLLLPDHLTPLIANVIPAPDIRNNHLPLLIGVVVDSLNCQAKRIRVQYLLLLLVHLTNDVLFKRAFWEVELGVGNGGVAAG